MGSGFVNPLRAVMGSIQFPFSRFTTFSITSNLRYPKESFNPVTVKSPKKVLKKILELCLNKCKGGTESHG